MSRPYVIAGPCSAESLEQVLTTAEGLSKVGVDMFRAGIWKPRSHPGCFEGVGERGLQWLRQVQSRYGMKVGCEVATAEHVELCLKYGMDMVWIGARTTTNPFLVQTVADALAGSDLTVLVKNPANPDLDLWIGALERMEKAGIKSLAAVHRGFSSYQKIQYRNDPLWQIAIGLRSRMPGLPVYCDPSHIAGRVEYVQEVAQRALDLGLDGLMVEVHCKPCEALSDAAQQLTPAQLSEMFSGPGHLQVRNFDSDDNSYRESIEQLRAQIDVVDDELLALLSQRMELSRQIGRFKKANNIAIVQSGRWEAVMERVLAQGRSLGLTEDFIRNLFAEIHKESISKQ